LFSWALPRFRHVELCEEYLNNPETVDDIWNIFLVRVGSFTVTLCSYGNAWEPRNFYISSVWKQQYSELIT